jgi:hypothetical protein
VSVLREPFLIFRTFKFWDIANDIVPFRVGCRPNRELLNCWRKIPISLVTVGLQV